MRRLLLLPAAALLLLAAPALATGPSGEAPPGTREVPLVAADQGVGAGWSGEAEVPAQLVGVEWSGDPGAQFAVSVRDATGAFTPAVGIGKDDVGPDPGSAEARHVAEVRAASGLEFASEPVWVGDATAVRVQVTSGQAQGVTLVAVATPDAAVPSGSAGAAGVVPSVEGPQRYAFGAAVLVLAGLLGAVALGWSPWPRGRGRRAMVLTAALAVLLTACLPAAQTTTTTTTTASSTGSSGGSTGGSTGTSGSSTTSSWTSSTGAVVSSQSRPTIISRSSWGGGAWNCTDPIQYTSPLKFAVVHHTAGSNDYTSSQSAGIVKAIWQYHTGTLGYCDIAYNFLIDRYGQLFEGRQGGTGSVVLGAHTLGFNSNSTGVAILGTFTGVDAPSAAQGKLTDLLAWKFALHKVDPTLGFSATASTSTGVYAAGQTASFPWAIVGHRDLYTTECPGAMLYADLPDLRLDTAETMGLYDPYGRLESATRADPDANVANNDRVRVVGWAKDANTSGALTVDIRVDGVTVASVSAGVARGGSIGNHGFDTTITVADGSHTICARAQDVGRGSSVTLPSCKSV